MRMTRARIMEILEEQKREVEALGHIVYYMALKGSQNYCLDDMTSDVDSLCVIIPTIQQMFCREKITQKIVSTFGEIDVKDMYSFIEIAKKGNIQTEFIHSKYKIGSVDDFLGHITMRPKALSGMCGEKIKALCHRYPSRVDWIDKFGFDPKQLHHIIRIYDISELNKEYDCMKYSFYDYADNEERRVELIKLKRLGIWKGKVLTPDEAKALALELTEKVKENIAHMEQPTHEIDYSIPSNIVKSYYM
ncbi:MAG: hypothetical protein ACRC5M_03010 [Anaeroplasmataceae bacterium]